MSHVWRKFAAVALVALCLALLVPLPATAQTEELRLGVTKIIGSQMGADIQGQISVSASGPGNLASVTFYIDGQTMGTASQAPFRLVFDTGNYAPGKHAITATGRTADGRSVNSAPLNVNILSASEANQILVRILVPLLVVVGLVVVFGAGGSSWLAARNQRKHPGLPQTYGIMGGAICPKCGRPFALSAFNMNMPTGKLARCPYCGKWSVVRRASPQALEAAAASETAGAQPAVAELSEEEKLRKQIEESRYR